MGRDLITAAANPALARARLLLKCNAQCDVGAGTCCTVCRWARYSRQRRFGRLS